MTKTSLLSTSAVVSFFAMSGAVFLALPTAILGDESKPATVAESSATEAATSAAFPGLGAPLVCKLDWNISSPVAADLDGDGRKELLVLNNDTGRIELLYQRSPDAPAPARKVVRSDRWTPELDSSHFRRESIAGDVAMNALAVADLNGDGMPDILFTSARGGLHVVLQGPNRGEWRPAIKENVVGKGNPAGGSRSLCVFPVARGKNGPVWAVAQQTESGIALRVFGEGALSDGRLPEPTLLRTAPGGQLFRAPIFVGENPAARPFARRVLGTIRAVPGENEVLLNFRRIVAPGPVFGPETTLKVPVSDIDFETPLEGADASGHSPAYAALNTRLKTLLSVRFHNDSTPLKASPNASIQRYSFPLRSNAASDGDSGAVAFFDTAGQGLTDVVVSDSSAAKILVYRARPNGEYAPPTEHPSPPNLTAFAPVPAAARTLLALNAKDGILAAIPFGADGVPSFPVSIPLPEDLKPVSLAASASANIAAKDAPFTVLLAKKGGANLFYKITPVADAKPAAAAAAATDTAAKKPKAKTDAKTDVLVAGIWQLTPLAQIAETRRDITALHVFDLNGDGRPDILACVEREAPRFWLQQADGTFTETAANSPFRRTLLDNISSADLSPATVNGTPAFLATTQGFLRAFRIAGDGSLEILLQANARNPEDRLHAPLLLDANTIAVWNATTSSLDWFEREENKTPAAASSVWKIRASTRLPAFEPRAARLQTVAGESGSRLLYTTPGAIVQIPTDKRGIAAELKTLYENDLPGFSPNTLLTGSFLFAPKNQAPRNPASPRVRRPQASVSLFDFNSHVLQILHPKTNSAANTAATWEEALHFTLFDDNPHYRGRRDSGSQPRAGLVADLTGDNIGDLVLLMHDRVFVYPGLPAVSPP